uniref:HAT C-terminal dimerisation domain-containing protein n=1 Tax=Anopheles dirus TaxID=7168 RepID=A0A182NT07_9DIPT
MLDHFNKHEDFFSELGQQYLELGNRFVKSLTEALKQRLKTLKENIFFKAALLIDPRFNYLNSNTNTTHNIVTDFDIFFTELYGGLLPGSDVGTAQTSPDRFVRQLNALDLETHQNSTFNVWHHWMSRKYTHPELYEVATLLLAVPSNQVSVERAFSALGLVLSDKRTKMNDDTLENILLIKLNKTLFEKILPNLYT